MQVYQHIFQVIRFNKSSQPSYNVLHNFQKMNWQIYKYSNSCYMNAYNTISDNKVCTLAVVELIITES